MPDIRDLAPEEFPALLREIPDPPKTLRCRGNLSRPDHKLLAVVGSRKYSTYGREMCEEIISGLKGFPITIVSGLALGIDAIAHRSALKANLQTIAVPGSGLSKKVLYPLSHYNLAEEIVASGGGLLSEFPDDTIAAPWTFPRRNRIMAGMSHATLVVEAEKISGTLITSRLATDYNRDVGAVPGSVLSPTSQGPHLLIKLGAALIENSSDALALLGIKENASSASLFDNLSKEEQMAISLLEKPMDRDTLIRKLALPAGKAYAILSLLEIKGLIEERLGEIHKKID